MRYLVFLATRSNSHSLLKCAIFIQRHVRGPHPFSTYLVKIHIFH